MITASEVRPTKLLGVSTRERTVDRANALARRLVATSGHDVRLGRRDRGLSLGAVGHAVGMSESKVSRIERGLEPNVSLADLARLNAAVGNDLVVRSYPGAQPLRDAGHARLLAEFRTNLHRTIRLDLEAPLPEARDQRAWDGLLIGGDPTRPTDGRWRFGVEAETAPRDAQALIRRIKLKERDGMVDGVILLLRRTRQTQAFLVEATELLVRAFPFPGPRALELLRAGVQPGGSSVVVLGPARRVGLAPGASSSGMRAP